MNPFKKDKKQIGIFVTAGFPKLNSLGQQLLFLQQQGIDFIEIGIPFSDPMADGPMIQYSSEVAIANGITLEHIFEQIEEIRDQLVIPLVFMGNFNPVMHYGLERFLAKCLELKISGLIFPDLSSEIVEHKYKDLFDQFDVPLIHLVTPRSSNQHIQKIARSCKKSFVYLIGQNSTTGTKFEQTASLLSRYKEISDLSYPTPVFLGFGIDSKEKKEIGFSNCDGVIVGSAYLTALNKNKETEFLEKLIEEI